MIHGYQTLITSLASLEAPVRPTDDDIMLAARSIAANETLTSLGPWAAPLPEAITWRIEGPFDSSYSLALLNREIARALKSLGHTVLLHSSEGPGDFPPNERFLQANPDIDKMYRAGQGTPAKDVDVVSRNLYPPRVHDMKGRIRLLHSYAWEESGFPLKWAEDFNRHLQGITCLSRHVEKILIDHGVTVPISTSGCGVDHWEHIEAAQDFVLNARTFRFLHVSSCFPRKGVDALLEAYGRSFRDADDVTLVIKSFPNPHNDVRKQIAACKERDPGYPDVMLIEDDLEDARLKALYQHCHCFVSPSRAEGFGLPVAEAVLRGLPVITTAWGGQTAFCDETTAWLTDYRFERAQTHFELSDSVWAEPDVEDLAKRMREVYEAPALDLKIRVTAAQKRLEEKFRWSDVARRLVSAARELNKEPPVLPRPRIGWVTTWNTRCGVASYSGHLIEQMPGDITVLAAHTDAPTAEDGSNVVRCWSEGGQDDLAQLSTAIQSIGLDVLVIQFNYGFFDFEKLSRFMKEQVSCGRIVVITLHSTSDPAHDSRKRLVHLRDALGLCQRVLVHSIRDLNRLKSIGLIDNVTLFPHGVSEIEPARVKRPAVLGRTIIGSYGFFLPHKGLNELIEATALCVADGLDLHLLMVNAQYPIRESAAAINGARQRIEALGLGNRVSMITDFLPDAESQGWLQHADLLVFPYQESGESTSAAVRGGLASGRAVAVTPLPVFEDVRPAVFALPGGSPLAIAEGIKGCLTALRQRHKDALAILESAQRWRSAHASPTLARRLYGMLVALSRCRLHNRRNGGGQELTNIFRPGSRQTPQPSREITRGENRCADWLGGKTYHIRANDPRLHTQVGRRDAQGIHSTGEAGCLLFGPYMPIDAGHYVLTVYGLAPKRGTVGVRVDVACEAGTRVLGDAAFSPSREDAIDTDHRLAGLRFEVPARCDDLEIRVWVPSGRILTVSWYEIVPLGTGTPNTGPNEARHSGLEPHLPCIPHGMPPQPKEQKAEIQTLVELDDALRMLDAAATVSDDELRRGFSRFSMRFPYALPPDPDSAEYRAQQFRLYEYLAGKPYDKRNEVTNFNLTAAVDVPFPYYTRSSQTVGNHLIAIGHVIRTLEPRPGATILEFGPGWGNTTMCLARMGCKVTAVDIEHNFVRLIALRANRKNLPLEVLQGDFSLIHTMNRKFDAVLFFESFHHCSDHHALIAGLDKVVAPGGKVVFAAEPITDDFPMPWGLRLDGESLWAIRNFGWLELGFRETYFRELLARHGWRIQKDVCSETPWGTVFTARRLAEAQ